MTLQMLSIVCPSCGGARRVQVLNDLDDGWHFAGCSTCGGTGAYPPEQAPMPKDWRERLTRVLTRLQAEGYEFAFEDVLVDLRHVLYPPMPHENPRDDDPVHVDSEEQPLPGCAKGHEHPESQCSHIAAAADGVYRCGRCGLTREVI